MNTDPETKHEKPLEDQAVTVSVNFKPVTFKQREVTGLQIKEAAKAQGVNIHLDFVLFLEKGNGRRDAVRDDETVHLHPNQKFEAVPGDDNS